MNSNETLVLFNVSSPFTSIPVLIALDIIKRKLTDHILQEGTLSPHPRRKLITLLELFLNNCVFSFQQKFYKQLQEAAMGSPVSPVISNIYVEYLEELAMGLLCPITTP